MVFRIQAAKPYPNLPSRPGHAARVPVPVPDAWGAALQIRQRKVGFAIAAVGGTQQRKEGRILRERQQLAVTPRPAFGRKVEWENANFGYKWICHVFLLQLPVYLDFKAGDPNDELAMPGKKPSFMWEMGISRREK